MDAMSKKERLARGSAVIKVMKVIPRPGHFLKTYLDPRKLPKKPNLNPLKGVLADMPHLDVKSAEYNFSPKSAKVPGMLDLMGTTVVCEDNGDEDEDPTKLGLPDGDNLTRWYGYREWLHNVNPTSDGNIADHFNVMLGLLISMSVDPDNENFPDVEAYPCVQFLKTIKSPDGTVPYNCGAFIGYIEYVAQKMLDEG